MPKSIAVCINFALRELKFQTVPSLFFNTEKLGTEPEDEATVNSYAVSSIMHARYNSMT